MEQRVYNGGINPEGLANALVDEWDQGETIAQAWGEANQIIVQIGQREGGFFSDEPHQALTLAIQNIGNGVQVTMGQQRWQKEGIQFVGGGMIGFFPFFFAFPLGQIFGEQAIDERLPGRVWRSIERYTAQYDAPAPATGQTQRLPTVDCPQCGVSNPLGAQRCSACGADLTLPPGCPNCGHRNPPGASFCNRCGTQLSSAA